MRPLRLTALALGIAATLPAADRPLLLQMPALSQSHIAFVYAGDLWRVARDGGEAVRLTTGVGIESNPVFSPDGKTLAFTAQYDGNVDVYVVPAAGGVPKRVTYHPGADMVQGWTPDGKRILFASSRTAATRSQELFTIGVEGGLPERIPLPNAAEGSLSPDGKRIAYVPLRRPFSTWKRYRGGLATSVWFADLTTSQVEPLPRKDSNDFNPMWAGDKVYFLSDREGPATLFACDPKTKAVTRLLPSEGEALKSAAAGPGAIVFEKFGSLGLYDLKTGRTTTVKVSIQGDLPELRERFENVGRALGNPTLSPTGARAAFEARGEILTVPAEKGDARNLTQTPGVMERNPSWSPDGRWIACFSDAAGEYALHLKPQDGKGETKILALEEKPGFYFNPTWSPDSKRIAYSDAHGNLWHIGLDSQPAVKVDQEPFYSPTGGLFHPAWSPDSRFLAYVKRGANHLGALFVYELATRKIHPLSDGMSDVRCPVFDKDGKHLYFAASTDSGASLQPDVHSSGGRSNFSLYVAVLSASDPSPFAPESDEEKGEEKKPEANGKPDGKPKTPDVKLDVAGFSQRILSLPLPAGNYVRLMAGKAGTLFAMEAPAGAPGLSVRRHELKSRKSDVPYTGLQAFVVSATGEKALTRMGGAWSIAAVKPLVTGSAPMPPAPPAPGGGALKVEGLEVKVDPKAEWAQMFKEGVRIQREFFYDPNHHGLDLKWLEKHYGAWLPAVASRQDLNYLMSEALGEVTVSHLGVGGGNVPEARFVGVGLLGADYDLHQGRYRFAKVFNGENWNPGLRAPLSQPGVNVKVGEYLLAVNGRSLAATDSIHAFLQNTAGRQVMLKVGPNPDGTGSREVTVEPVGSEQALRHFDWIEGNRRWVEQASNGRVGYVYMPDTANGGYAYFNRYFYAQVGKEALIVDERWNGGGALATDIIELLKRPPMSKVATRDGLDEPQPQGAIHGPKVMLINETAGSGGDAMPYYFKKAGVGKLVGKRTWGGLVGRSMGVQLMDGGAVRTPTSGVWDPHTREWIAENIGVAPDVEVELEPAAARAGRDTQLEKGLALVMAELPKTTPAPVARPAYPVYKR